jgi:hypothetical protein
MPMIVPEDSSLNEEFQGVTPSRTINTIDNAERPKSPEMFVGRENSRTPRLPKLLPAGSDPKKFEKELNRTKHTYERTFADRNVVAFENWGIQLKKKKVHTGWALKKLE